MSVPTFGAAILSASSVDLLSEVHLLRLLGDGAPIFAALCAGHALADFCFQSRAMVDAKLAGNLERRLRGLVSHGLVVALLQALWLAPFGWRAMGIALPIAVLHVAIDSLKPALTRVAGPMRAFALDQLAHVAVLVGAYLLLWTAFPSVYPSYSFTYCAVFATAFAFVTHGAGTIVQLTLTKFAPSPEPSAEGAAGSIDPADAPAHADDVSRGRFIGILERLMILALVLVDQWAAIGLIITAKSVARFKRIEEDQAFGEIYLIGTLTSVLVALAAGAAVRLAL